MKKFLICLMAVLVFTGSPVMAYKSAKKVDPNDQAVVTMLWMVHSDLQMCRNSLDQSFMNNVSAIGHLNNSQSALKKTHVDPAYYTLVGEVDKRISKIKFYLVMNERRAVVERLDQLMAVIRNVLGEPANMGGGNYYPGNPSNPSNGSFGIPGGSGFAPPVSPETPVGGGQLNPSMMPTLPSGVVPAN